MSGSVVVRSRKRQPACRTLWAGQRRLCSGGSARMIGSTARLIDLCRRRGTVIARTSAAAGLTLTLAGALAPTATATAPVATGHGGSSLRAMLNPSGAESHADPTEEMTAQQSFAAKHFGAAGLSSPLAKSAAMP